MSLRKFSTTISRQADVNLERQQWVCERDGHFDLITMCKCTWLLMQMLGEMQHWACERDGILIDYNL